MSKRNDMYVVRSNEGYWVPLIKYFYAKSKKELFEVNFTNENHFYLKNRKSLSQRCKMNYINMYKLSILFDSLDRGFEFKITREDFGEEYQQVSMDIVEFLNKYNREAKIKLGSGYCEIYI
jgi:molecular chaperone DnaK (HSP70)